ncbi:MAG TPA: ethanolamine ammonia-lyase subunit EutC [Oligoflexus sp.]|uniref:ethanolamine ammonia-lyase subunit EutC n=1 Tax=Oligoflexus sp. TaxID=1971216 RepID=UPI002D7FF276|nr:ethanolamine ammonia-lyase subunit EutC [Oligoflexus sp.]HET9240664.1 ethanolamine ammonia-lyase subunit EutC [Oligoflexus sp.]
MTQNPWRNWTQARVGLGRYGSSVPTREHLKILEAQALARDSLWRSWNTAPLEKFLASEAIPFQVAATEVRDRQHYLMRPDLGRRLHADSFQSLKNWKPAADTELVFCVTDGLSTDAMDKQLIPFLKHFLPALRAEAFFRQKPYPFVLLPFARVATADAVAEALKSRLSVIFVGERPGLSAHDSMGIYLTYNPSIGTLDSRRNCISNVRVPDGLGYELATQQLLYLLRESLRLGLSGVELKLDLPATGGVITSG